MGNLTKIKLSAVLAVLVLGFQNCGSKNNYSGVGGDSVELDKLIKQEEKPDDVNEGDFDVVSYTLNSCVGTSCTTELFAFRSKQTISFRQGSVSGRAACNLYGGKYALTVRPNESTNLIKIDTLISTLMACGDLAEEQALLNGLSAAYKITDLNKDAVDIYTSISDKEKSQFGTLKLRRKSVITPVPAKGSIVGEFKAISVSQSLCRADMKYDVVGPCVIQSTVFKSNQRVRFSASGVVSGKAACNTYSGKYVLEKREKESTDLITISNVIATQMACTLLSEEEALFKAFSEAYKAEVSDNKVVLYLKSGTLTLQRVK